MSRTARISSLAEALTCETIAIAVVVRNGEATIAPALRTSLADFGLPALLNSAWCQRHGLKNEPGSTVVLRSVSGASLALISLGSSPTSEHFRLAGASAVRSAGEGTLAVLVASDASPDPAEDTHALVEGAVLASYSFKHSAYEGTIDVVPVGVPLPTISVHDQITAALNRARTIAECVNWARQLVDTPAGDLSPKALARAIDDRLSDDPGVSVEVWGESRIERERLGGLLGVGRGSAQPTRLVYATYDPEPGASIPHVALVGKGVTFDSGGLSIKSGDGMMTMKTDMTGAAIVMATLSIASRLALKVRVTAIAPLTENLLGAKATKPGDVLTIRNGMTIEVLNTDAEGRLILADGLSLAAETSADVIIDVATLTGAQNVALGDEVGALYSTDDELANALLRASALSGEMLWRMPLVDAYESHIDSEVADMKNIGKPPRAGSIVAALLLRRFVAQRAWAHLDIAGPARADAVRGYNAKGATAFSTRALVAYLRERDRSTHD